MHASLILALALPLWPLHLPAETCDRVPIWRDGRGDGSVCPGDAGARGLTILDLGDDWVPPVLAPAGDDPGPSYRETYLALAQERFSEAGAEGELAAGDRYLELHGIAPSFGVVRARLADEARHRCHDAVDGAALASAPDRIAEEGHAAATARIAGARALRARLEHDRERRHLADLDALAAIGPYYRASVARLAAMEAYLGAVRAAQAHLACDGLYRSRPIDGAYTWQTSLAVAAFQRGTMILPTGILDPPTRDALAASRERDFRTALRGLRERVIAATGLVEDGTAGTGKGTVLGHTLESEETWRVRGHTPLDGAAPDLVSPATEAAARALGWRDAESARAFLDTLAASPAGARRVAVPLPPPPAYHGAAMELSAEIDRGDVWIDPAPRWRPVPRRPALILYATADDRRIPLVRWPTTIGGWQRTKVDGRLEMRWKASPAGPRIWRDLFVGPRWLPPRDTPDRELVRWTGDRYVLARELFGPSYRGAFGLVAFVHLVEERVRGEALTRDQGIRTHGTGNLVSLANGVSHGCHRLLGIHAIRLADFVLAHRAYRRHGDAPASYRRVVTYRRRFPIAIDSLGYRLELDPPIPVNVLPGRVHR